MHAHRVTAPYVLVEDSPCHVVTMWCSLKIGLLSPISVDNLTEVIDLHWTSNYRLSCLSHGSAQTRHETCISYNVLNSFVEIPWVGTSDGSGSSSLTQVFDYDLHSRTWVGLLCIFVSPPSSLIKVVNSGYFHLALSLLLYLRSICGLPPWCCRWPESRNTFVYFLSSTFARALL